MKTVNNNDSRNYYKIESSNRNVGDWCEIYIDSCCSKKHANEILETKRSTSKSEFLIF